MQRKKSWDEMVHSEAFKNGKDFDPLRNEDTPGNKKDTRKINWHGKLRVRTSALQETGKSTVRENVCFKGSQHHDPL